MELRFHQQWPSDSPLDLPDIPKNLRVRLYSYAQPMTGNREFVDFFQRVFGEQSMAEDVYRLVGKHDLVPLLPPRFLGYHHIGDDRYYWVDWDEVNRFDQRSSDQMNDNDQRSSDQMNDNDRRSSDQMNDNDQRSSDQESNDSSDQVSNYSSDQVKNNNRHSWDGATYQCSETAPQVESEWDGRQWTVAVSTMAKPCRFHGYTRYGHVSYYWNLDAIRDRCRVI